MLDSVKLHPLIKDSIKVIIFIKVLTLIILSGTESVLKIYAVQKKDSCIHTIKKTYSHLKEDFALSKAVGFCNGGYIVEDPFKKNKR